jgi:hypothetical protein
MIEEKDWAVNENRNQLLLWWGISLTVLFMSLIIPLTIKESKVNKKKSETLYQRLVRLCNPKNFIDNYDKEKVDKANIIYKRLLETTPDNNDALIEIQIQSSSELGINFIDKAELEDLREKVNPKRFLNPYNAEKVSLANELYAILAKDQSNIWRIDRGKRKIKTIINMNKIVLTLVATFICTWLNAQTISNGLMGNVVVNTEGGNRFEA